MDMILESVEDDGGRGDFSTMGFELVGFPRNGKPHGGGSSQAVGKQGPM